MHEPDSPEISSADVPLRKPADRSGMGIEGMGSRTGTDAGGDRKPKKSGTNQEKGNGAGYRPEKEGLTMTREEAEKKIEKLILEIADVYQEYHPDGELLNMAVTKTCCWAFNAYWKMDIDHPLDAFVRREAK
jgi:hypothetical protein